MTIWDWIHEQRSRAEASGDREGLRLCRLHADAYELRQDDPARMMEMLDEGRRIAQRRREPWWAAFFEHWQIETLIYYLEDYREVVERAVKLTLEVRRPAFDGFPLRFGVWCNLVAAYLCVDARGHAAAIREALAYLRTVTPDEGGDAYLLMARRHWFAYEMGDYAEAERLARQELAMCQGDDDRNLGMHHEVDTHKALCWIAFRTGDVAMLDTHARAGEELARRLGYSYEQALCTLWRAVCAIQAGDEHQARPLFRQGVARMGRLGQPPGESYFDAVARYHELAGDPEAEWATREAELAAMRGKGQSAYETMVRIKRVRLLRRLGRPWRAEEDEARAAAGKLRDPAWHLRELLQ